MAIIKRAFWDPSKNKEELFIDDGTGVSARMSIGAASIEVVEGDVVITTEKGKKLSVSNLLDRLEALENAYMEDKLLGTKPGKIDT